MTFILWMRFFIDNMPVAIVWEEGVSLSRSVINLCQTQTVGHTDGLLIDTCSTYYIYVLLRLTTLECSLEGGIDIAARQFADSR